MKVLLLEAETGEPLRAFAAGQPHPYRLLASEDRHLLVVEAVSPQVARAGLALEDVRGWVFELVEEGCKSA